MICRQQLETVVNKKKIAEVHQWFHEHFIASSQETYSTKCPLLVIQGPTGCGKTSTLKCIARELKISIQDYSETTDTTAINYALAGSHTDTYESNEEKTLSIAKRKANKFERFVIEHLRFTTLYPVSDEPPPPTADSEFESDDDFSSTLPNNRPLPKPKPSGIIIHLEAPLSFARSQKVFIQTILRLIKVIRDSSRSIMRRIAIVFESLECERETFSLPAKLKNSLGIQTIKFNPIIRANMKRFIEMHLKNFSNFIIDREAIELLINDCDGDLRACNNTLELLQSRASTCNNVLITSSDLTSLNLLDANQVSKRQRLNPNRLKLNVNLLRGVTKSLGFFHTLGKIFYQKRLYPPNQGYASNIPRWIDRPYPTENSTEYLVSRLEISSKMLLAWLHQHYHKFCHATSVEKAAVFLDYLSDIDSISIDATQSSQFYEMHTVIDQLQSHLAIEATAFSLYEDQSKITKSSHKKISLNGTTFTLKSSIECSANGNGDLYSFNKPVSLSVPKLIDDHRMILSHLMSLMAQSKSRCVDTEKVLVDYLPYLKEISANWSKMNNSQMTNCYLDVVPSIIKNEDSVKLINVIADLESHDGGIDLDQQHEKLIDLIDDLEKKTKAKSNDYQNQL